LSCDDLVDFGQCVADAFDKGCFWLYDSASGTTGECRAKENNGLGCGDAKTMDQCTWDDVDGFGVDCFWLYDSASGATGECRARDDGDLKCADANTPGQCTWGKVAQFGMNCMWLEGNVIGQTYTKAQCVNRVCLGLHLWCCDNRKNKNKKQRK
jgi:hypothetical protein